MRNTGKKRLVQSTLVAVAALVLATQSQAEASEFEGRIRALRMNETTSARVSILVGPHNSPCMGSDGEWFAFEEAGQPVGSLWVSALNAALVDGRRVFILGNDQCDAFGIEGVDFIDFFAR